MFEAFGNHAEGESLHARNSFIAIGTGAHDASESGYFGQPPAIIFALKLDGKGHPSTVASGQQSNDQMEPSRRTVLRKTVSQSRAAHLEHSTHIRCTKGKCLDSMFS